jgi:hypothetical protein
MANREHGFRTVTDGASQVHRTLGVEHSRSCFLHEHATRLSEVRDSLAVANKKLKAKLIFEYGYLLGQGRLADVQPLGRAREIQFFGQNDDCVQVTHFDVWEQHLKPPMDRSSTRACTFIRHQRTRLSGTQVGNFHSMWKLSSIVNLNTPFGREPQVYNVSALVPLSATVSNPLILREKKASREDMLLR